MAYLMTNEYDRIIGIVTIGGKPAESDTQKVYEIYAGDIPPLAIPNLGAYSYDGKTFTKLSDIEIKQTCIKEYKISKIETMRSMCNFSIISGIDIGDDHYSLNTEDQLNIARLGVLSENPNNIIKLVYHADGKQCRIYSNEEMSYLYHKSSEWINYHTTYFNLLKQYIESLTNVLDVLNVNYLMELPDEYMEQLNEYVDVKPYDFQFTTFVDTKTYDGIVPKIDATFCIEEWKKEMKKQEDIIKETIFNQ